MSLIGDFFRTPKRSAAFEGYETASNTFDEALAAIDSYSIEAIHRLEDFTVTRQCKNYTSAELEAHTGAIDHLKSKYDILCAAYNALPLDHRLFPVTNKLHTTYGESFVFAVEAFAHAGRLSVMTALSGKAQNAKDEAKLWLLNIANPHRPASEQATHEKKATAMANNISIDAAKFTLLEQKGMAAEEKANALLAVLTR